MLIKCPECDLQVSTKAIVCPHCGFPLTDQPKQTKLTKKKPKRKKLPNGFGQISEIKNQNLRKPFRAVITVGKNAKGRPICKPLKPESFFQTYNEAYEALVEYNRDPYSIQSTITMQQLYERWFAEYSRTLQSENSIRTITSAWAKVPEIYNYAIKDIRVRHLKNIIQENNCSANQKSRIKSLFNLIFDYAVEYELVPQNYARQFSLSNEIVKEMKDAYRGHIAFKDEEISILWEHIDKPIVQMILIECYSGWRPQELINLTIENIHLDEGYMVGGMKTDAGRNRVVPIHEKIKDLVKKWYDEANADGRKYLFNCSDGLTHKKQQKMTYDKYRLRFLNVMKEYNLNPEHKPHDCRMHFITQCKKYQLDEYAIKYIVGHSINDITEKVYTQREIDWLIEEMRKLK